MYDEEITNGEDIIQASDIDGRIKRLEDAERAAKAAGVELEDWDADELAALRELRASIASQIRNPGNVTLIRESYFEDYARDQADDIGDCSAEGSVSAYVNWSSYADALKMDYASVSFAGVTYWMRG